MITALLEDQSTLTLDSVALTDRGHKRKINEDTVFEQSRRLESGERVGLYIVCDGMGGHRAGEVASRLAVETVRDELKGLPRLLKTLPDYERHLILRQSIRTAIAKANTNIRQYAKTYASEAAGLGTTITLAFVYDGIAQIANVGDGRAYVWRSGRVVQITQDHSFAAELARRGLIDESEVATHPRSNLISRALGMQDEIEVDFFDWELQAGDKLLLCTDGLWKVFSDAAELARQLNAPQTLEEIGRQLVAEALKRDGLDNISAVVVGVEKVTA